MVCHNGIRSYYLSLYYVTCQLIIPYLVICVKYYNNYSYTLLTDLLLPFGCTEMISEVTK